MVIDYSKYNRCVDCKINYPKTTRFCKKCGYRVRTVAHIVKAEVKERVRQLDKKRY